MYRRNSLETHEATAVLDGGWSFGLGERTPHSRDGHARV